MIWRLILLPPGLYIVNNVIQDYSLEILYFTQKINNFKLILQSLTRFKDMEGAYFSILSEHRGMQFSTLNAQLNSKY